MDYIALRVGREPLDQTDLSNGLDTSSKAVVDRLSKLVDRWDQGGPGGPTYRPGGPTCQQVGPRFGGSPS